MVLGMGYFCDQFFSKKAKVSSGIHPNTCKYNVSSIKLETKVMPLHKLWV